MASPGKELPKSKLTVRHYFSTMYVSTLNEHLTDDQRSVISKTPFGWFLQLSGRVPLNSKILRELTLKWVDSSNGFVIGEKLVNMDEKEFCFGLGLSSEGASINLKGSMVASECVKYLGKGSKDLNFIFKFLMKKHKKEIPCRVFCSLYILVGISEILFPIRYGRVFPIMFDIVDNLSRLSTYCWGTLVYRYLLESLSTTSDSVKKGKAVSDVVINGCVYMLQVWFCEHFVPPEGAVKKSPRILHWMDRNVGDNIVKLVFEMGVIHVVDDLGGGSLKDNTYVKETKSHTKRNDDQPSTKKMLRREQRESLMRTVQEQECALEELRRNVNVVETQLEEEKARRRGRREDDACESGGRPHPFSDCAMFSPGGMWNNEVGGFSKTDDAGTSKNTPDGKKNTEPEMKTYVRMGSRMRHKSQVLRTPYTGNIGPRKKNK